MGSLTNIFWLGIKELRTLLSDVVLVVFVIYAFTFSIYSQATGTSNEVNNASIAFADEDGSVLSKEIFNAFYPPRFQHPVQIHASEVEDAMDRGTYMFVVTIPPKFESDLRAGKHPDVQVSIDATALQQAGIDEAGNIGGFDRAVGDAARCRLDLDQRLQPVHTARTIAHDDDVELAGIGFGRERPGDAVGAKGEGCGIAGNVEANGHRRASAMRSFARSTSIRPCTSPSNIAAGAQEQSPRQ